MQTRNDQATTGPVVRRLGLVTVAVLIAWVTAIAATRMPPKTRTDNVKEVVHGVEIIDPYRWLEDQNSPETRAWIDAQNAHTQSLLGPLPGRAALKQRLAELMKREAVGMPRGRNGRYFFSKRAPDQELPIIYVRKSANGPDEVLIDPHPLSADRRTSVSLIDVSQDGTLIAYATRQGGEDEHTVSLMQVDSRKELPDRLPKARYWGVEIRPDKKGFYYVRHGKGGPRVYYHALGTAPENDQELFGKGRKGKGSVAVKYRDPKNPENTWTGRGRMPRWMVAATKGRRASKEDFLI